MNHIDAFRDAIAAAGLTPPHEIIDDGKRHRFSSNGVQAKKNGWYILHGDDRPAGAFGCWASDISVNWKHDQPRTEFTPEERKAWAERKRQVEAERDAEIQEAAAQAASKASELWAAAGEGPHPYLTRKQIDLIGARVQNDILLVPMKHSAKQLVGLQRIYPDGSKRFIKGTPKAGAYTTLGTPSKNGTVVICEGYATGVSIHMATKHCVVIAFDCGNLLAVAKKIRAALPDACIVLAADDDYRTEGNPGITHAIDAAKAIGGMLATPRWYGDRPEKSTDFNDLHIDEGLQAVAECLHGADYPGGDESFEGRHKATVLGGRSNSDPADPSLTNQLNATSESTTKPESGGGQLQPGNTGSVSAGTPFPAGDAVQEGASSSVILQGAGPDVIVDYHQWLPDTNDKGKPLSTIENVAEVCRRLGVIVRYNVISKEEEILIPGAGFSLDNRQNASLAWLISECAKFRLPVDRVPDFITYLGDQNQHNPVAQWITSKPWDGQDRLSDLMDTVQAKNEAKDARVAKMKRAFITRWMVSAIAGAFRPNGVSAHGVLVFQGAQYVGKTKWFKQLVPAGLGVLKDGMLLRPDDRDSVMKCVSNWLVELGEIDATFRKSDVAALKSFLTSDRDVLRRAYARKESAFARRTVFFASVNPKNYLHDETGNRRYWTIEVEWLDHSHGIDMQQCWAQVHDLWAKGESWFLQPDEMELLNEHNKDFEVVDPIEDLITNGLRWRDDEFEWKWRTPTEVLMTLGRQNCSKAETTKAGIILRKLNGDKAKRTERARLLLVPDAFRTHQQ